MDFIVSSYSFVFQTTHIKPLKKKTYKTIQKSCKLYKNKLQFNSFHRLRNI